MAFGDEFLNRFGPYRLQPYDVPRYLGAPVGGPAGGQINVPGSTTPPPSGSGNGGGNGNGNGNGSGSPAPGSGSGGGSGNGGNAGGASHGPGGGGAGDNAGHPGANAAGLNGGLFGNMGPASYISLGPWGAGALQAASSLTPFPYSLAPTLASLAMRGYNTANTDAIRSSLGVPGLDLGQVLGSLLGLNDCGSLSGNQLVASKDQYKDAYGNPVGVSTGGIGYDSYGPLGLLGSGALETRYTPEEARLRQIANAASPPVAPRPTTPQAGPPLPRMSFDHPVYAQGGKEVQGQGTIVGYRQADGAMTDANGTIISGGTIGTLWGAPAVKPGQPGYGYDPATGTYAGSRGTVGNIATGGAPAATQYRDATDPFR
jgi:hypothetical protein